MLKLVIILMLVIQATDLITTVVGLAMGLSEQNPIMATLMQYYGTFAFITIKIVLAVLLGFLIYATQSVKAGLVFCAIAFLPIIPNILHLASVA